MSSTSPSLPENFLIRHFHKVSILHKKKYTHVNSRNRWKSSPHLLIRKTMYPCGEFGWRSYSLTVSSWILFFCYYFTILFSATLLEIQFLFFIFYLFFHCCSAKLNKNQFFSIVKFTHCNNSLRNYFRFKKLNHHTVR